MIAEIPIGSDTVFGSVQVRAFMSAHAARLAFDDTGTFDVLPAERIIAWYPGPAENAAAVRADLLGRVMALAAHVDGALALHASAVSIDGVAIALLGPKHAGKSTLALSLVRVGARLLTDDTLVVRLDNSGAVWASPGVQQVRLWDDSARALDFTSRGELGAKPTIDSLARIQLESMDVRLDACYVLHAAAGDDNAPARRERMAPVQAALSCVAFSKLGALAGGSEGTVVLDRSARLVATVPVYTAEVPRNLTRLGAVATAFLEWTRHGSAANAVLTG
jgi:hypothetical protein